MKPPRTIRCHSTDQSRGEPARLTHCLIWPHAARAPQLSGCRVPSTTRAKADLLAC
jgi:hypothetical protein